MAGSVPRSSTTGGEEAGPSVCGTTAHSGFTGKVISTAECTQRLRCPMKRVSKSVVFHLVGHHSPPAPTPHFN